MRRFLGIGVFGISSLAPTVLRAQASNNPYELIDQFANTLVRIEADYVEPAPREKLVQGAIAGMVDALDPHSAYMTPDAFEDFKSDTSGQFGGIGVEVDLRNGQITVVAPIPGSPAERAGIHSGDRIVSIDGIVPDTLPLAEIVHRMRGKKGSRVRLTIRRIGSATPLSFVIERDNVRLPSVYVKQLDHAIAYVRLTTFQEGTHAELLDKLARLGPSKAIRGLLLDLRGNPGGLVSEAVAVADELLDTGLLFSTRHQGKPVEYIVTSSYGHFERIPMVTLVDAGTASAAEILAGALKDRHRSPIVGLRTFGKGTVQTIVDLPGGAGLRLTVLRYYTPAGLGIQASGIIPDEDVVEPDAVGDSPLRESDIPNHLPSERVQDLDQTRMAKDGQSTDNPTCPLTKPIESLFDRIARLSRSPTDRDSAILARGFKLLVSRTAD